MNGSWQGEGEGTGAHRGRGRSECLSGSTDYCVKCALDDCCAQVSQIGSGTKYSVPDSFGDMVKVLAGLLRAEGGAVQDSSFSSCW